MTVLLGALLLVTLAPGAAEKASAEAKVVRQAATKPAATAAPTPAPVRLPAPRGLSWDDADELSRKIARVERRLRTGRAAADEPIQVTQRELNSYLSLVQRDRIPEGVSGFELQLLRGGLGARALVDLDRVKGKLPQGAGASLLAFLSGTVPVELRGKLRAVGGQGRIEVEEASVGGLSLPVSLVAQLVSTSTRTAARPQGFDILAPFPLPWTARDVRLEPGRASITFFPKQP